MTWPDSPQGGRLGDGRYAHATDRPETVDALQQAVRDRVAQGHALYPQGGTTALDYGGIPERPGIALDLRSLNRLIDYPAADMTITVEAGITLETLHSVLAEQSQRLLIDVPQPSRATIGGVYATNTSGPRRFGAGRPRDQIIGVSFVTADGSLVKGGGRVVKNVAGYDFPKLLTGSMGTLGILSQITLKVRPIPEASALVGVPFASATDLGAALDQLNTSGTRPVAVEVLNASAARFVASMLGLPSAEWTLILGFEGNTEAVNWQLDRLKAELPDHPDFAVRGGAEAENGWSALVDLPTAELGPVTFLANLRPSSVAGFIAGLDPAAWAVQAHAGNGIVRGYALGAPALETVAAEIDRLRALAVVNGGNLTLPRCPTAWKERLKVWGEPRPDWSFAARIKQALDPQRVLNPGRFVGTI